MRPNPVSFLLLSMVLGILLMTLVVVGILTIDLNIEREFSRTTLDPQGMEHISIDNTVGEVSVHGSEREDVVIEVRKETYFGKDTLDRIDVDILTDSGIVITVDPDGGIFLYTVDIDVWVPVDLFVRDISMDLGSVKVDSVSHVGKIDVKAGDILLVNIDRIDRLDMDSGDVEVDLAGTISEVRMDNGDLDINLRSIDRNGTRIIMDSGEMTIKVPQNISFDFSLEVDSGDISLKELDVDFDTNRATDKKGRVNGGGDLLECEMDSGSITILGEVIE